MNQQPPEGWSPPGSSDHLPHTTTRHSRSGAGDPVEEEANELMKFAEFCADHFASTENELFEEQMQEWRFMKRKRDNEYYCLMGFDSNEEISDEIFQEYQESLSRHQSQAIESPFKQSNDISFTQLKSCLKKRRTDDTDRSQEKEEDEEDFQPLPHTMQKSVQFTPYPHSVSYIQDDEDDENGDEDEGEEEGYSRLTQADVSFDVHRPADDDDDDDDDKDEVEEEDSEEEESPDVQYNDDEYESLHPKKLFAVEMTPHPTRGILRRELPPTQPSLSPVEPQQQQQQLRTQLPESFPDDSKEEFVLSNQSDPFSERNDLLLPQPTILPVTSDDQQQNQPPIEPRQSFPVIPASPGPFSLVPQYATVSSQSSDPPAPPAPSAPTDPARGLQTSMLSSFSPLAHPSYASLSQQLAVPSHPTAPETPQSSLSLGPTDSQQLQQEKEEILRFIEENQEFVFSAPSPTKDLPQPPQPHQEAPQAAMTTPSEPPSPAQPIESTDTPRSSPQPFDPNDPLALKEWPAFLWERCKIYNLPYPQDIPFRPSPEGVGGDEFVIVYWAQGSCLHLDNNLALTAALWLARRLNVPIVGLTMLEQEVPKTLEDYYKSTVPFPPKKPKKPAPNNRPKPFVPSSKKSPAPAPASAAEAPSTAKKPPATTTPSSSSLPPLPSSSLKKLAPAAPAHQSLITPKKPFVTPAKRPHPPSSSVAAPPPSASSSSSSLSAAKGRTYYSDIFNRLKNRGSSSSSSNDPATTPVPPPRQPRADGDEDDHEEEEDDEQEDEREDRDDPIYHKPFSHRLRDAMLRKIVTRLQGLVSFQETLLARYHIPLVGFTYPAKYKKLIYHHAPAPPRPHARAPPPGHPLLKPSFPGYFNLHVNTKIPPEAAAFHALLGKIYELFNPEQSPPSADKKPRSRIVAIITDEAHSPLTEAIVSYFLSREKNIPVLAFDDLSLVSLPRVEKELADRRHTDGTPSPLPPPPDPAGLAGLEKCRWSSKEDFFLPAGRFAELFQQEILRQSSTSLAEELRQVREILSTDPDRPGGEGRGEGRGAGLEEIHRIQGRLRFYLQSQCDCSIHEVPPAFLPDPFHLPAPANPNPNPDAHPAQPAAKNHQTSSSSSSGSRGVNSKRERDRKDRRADWAQLLPAVFLPFYEEKLSQHPSLFSLKMSRLSLSSLQPASTATMPAQAPPIPSPVHYSVLSELGRVRWSLLARGLSFYEDNDQGHQATLKRSRVQLLMRRIAQAQAHSDPPQQQPRDHSKETDQPDQGQGRRQEQEPSMSLDQSLPSSKEDPPTTEEVGGSEICWRWTEQRASLLLSSLSAWRLVAPRDQALLEVGLELLLLCHCFGLLPASSLLQKLCVSSTSSPPPLSIVSGPALAALCSLDFHRHLHRQLQLPTPTPIPAQAQPQAPATVPALAPPVLRLETIETALVSSLPPVEKRIFSSTSSPTTIAPATINGYQWDVPYLAATFDAFLADSQALLAFYRSVCQLFRRLYPAHFPATSSSNSTAAQQGGRPRLLLAPKEFFERLDDLEQRHPHPPRVHPRLVVDEQERREEKELADRFFFLQKEYELKGLLFFLPLPALPAQPGTARPSMPLPGQQQRDQRFEEFLLLYWLRMLANCHLPMPVPGNSGAVPTPMPSLGFLRKTFFCFVLEFFLFSFAHHELAHPDRAGISLSLLAGDWLGQRVGQLGQKLAYSLARPPPQQQQQGVRKSKLRTVQDIVYL